MCVCVGGGGGGALVSCGPWFRQPASPMRRFNAKPVICSELLIGAITNNVSYQLVQCMFGVSRFVPPKQVLLNTFPNCWWHHHGICVHCTLHKGPNSGLPDMDMPIKVTGLIWRGDLYKLIAEEYLLSYMYIQFIDVTCTNIHGNTCLTTFPFVLSFL